MDREEILEKSKRTKPALVGEMENTKTNKGNWIAIISAGGLAVVLMILCGAFRQYSSIFAIGAVCYCWASVFYTCQYFMAKRPWAVLFGSVLHGLACVAMIVLYIVSNVQGWWI